MSKRQVRTPGRPYYQGRPEKRRQKKSFNGHRLKIYFKLAVFLTAGIWLLRYFNIVSIEVKGTSSLTPAQVEKHIDSSFDRHITWRNLLTLNQGAFERDLLKREPKLKSVQAKPKWPKKLLVEVVEKHPSVVWRSGNQNWLLDLDGTVISEAGDTTGLPVVTDSKNLPVSVGKAAVPARFVEFTSSIASQMQIQTGLKMTELIVPDTTTELYVKSDRGYVIKFDTTRPAGDQLTKLKTVLAELQKLGRTPAEYIDLRIESKAYFK